MSLKKLELEHKVDLRKCTAIKVGGKAKYFFTVYDLDDLCQIIRDFGSSFYLLGKGSNLLIKSGCIKKPVVKLAGAFSYVKEDANCIEIGASTFLPFLIKYSIENNLEGVENLAGIPATIGGLIAMNASSFGRDVSYCLREVQIMDYCGNVRTLDKSQIIFRYRFSSLQDCVILKAKFNLLKRDGLRQKVRDVLAKRLRLQEFDLPSCGCIFKNHLEFSAGFLIESCGLKGLKRGGAQVSSKHSNFIVNLGSASYEDIDYLIQRIKDRVYKKHRIVLEEEIKRWT